MKAGALTLLIISTAWSNPVLDLNFEDGLENIEKSSGFDATGKTKVTSGWVDQHLDIVFYRQDSNLVHPI